MQGHLPFDTPADDPLPSRGGGGPAAIGDAPRVSTPTSEPAGDTSRVAVPPGRTAAPPVIVSPGAQAATPVASPPPPPRVEPTIEFVRHPRARRYLIRVKLDGSVRVTIPRRGSTREAQAFVMEQRAWIAAQQLRVARVRERMPGDLPAEEQRRLRLQARRELPVRLLELAAPLGLTVTKVSIRNQRHRWGSCTAAGHISLNWRLVTMPDWVRDYVLYHELMHLKRMDHSPVFWGFVEEVCPRWREARAWLRRHALAPHAAQDGSPGEAPRDEDESDC